MILALRFYPPQSASPVPVASAKPPRARAVRAMYATRSGADSIPNELLRSIRNLFQTTDLKIVPARDTLPEPCP